MLTLPIGFGGSGTLSLFLLATSSALGQAVVDRVGPPSWWVEPAEQRVLLLIEGTGLEGARVRFGDGPVRVDRVEVARGGGQCSWM